jgi:hypothetical protein
MPSQRFTIADLAHMQALDQVGHNKSGLILRHKDTFSIICFGCVAIIRRCNLLDWSIS